MLDTKEQAFLNTAGNTVYLLSLWLLSVIATQYLGYKAVGELTLAMAIGNTVILLQLYGVRGFQSSDVSFRYSPATYFRARIITIVFGALIGTGSSFLMGYSSEFIITLSLFMLFRSSEAFSDVLYGDDQRMGRLELAGYSLFLRGVITSTLFFIGSFYFKSLYFSLIFIAIGGFLITIFLDIPLYWKTIRQCPKINSGYVSDLLRDCLSLLITTLIPAIIFAVPRIVLAHWYGAELLGYYGNLSTPAMLIITLVPNVLIAFLPQYGRMIVLKDYHGVVKLWFQSILGTMILLMLCLIAMFFWGRQVLSYIYTNQILPYVHFLYYVLIAMSIYAVEICCATVLVALRQSKALTISAFCSLFICLITSIPLVRSYGIIGAIAVLAASYIIQVLVQTFYIIRAAQSLNL